MTPEDFFEQGFVVVPGIFSEMVCDDAVAQLTQLSTARAGSRNLLAQPWCIKIASALKSHPAITPLLPEDAAVVQCTLFEKTADKNWGVGLHQDLSIPVRERVAAPECAGWAFKEGVLYTQPPPLVLESLVAIRVHLDPCPSSEGPLRVVPRSHAAGRLCETEAAQLRTQNGETVCVAGRGSVLVMRPLLLGASSRVSGDAMRRVLHFLVGPPGLPYGLHWHEAV
jgi:ectoine hydroxylase-related dioxygenase (phytanoyl-CoA dioxygenase family)